MSTPDLVDIAQTAWQSNPLTDPAMKAERDRVRFGVGRVLAGAPDLGGDKHMAVGWMGIACALADSLTPEQLFFHLNSLPPAFTRALEAALTAARLADHHGFNRDWRADQEQQQADEIQTALLDAIHDGVLRGNANIPAKGEDISPIMAQSETGRSFIRPDAVEATTNVFLRRLADEADLCRNDGADDIAELLTAAGEHMAKLAVAKVPTPLSRAIMRQHAQTAQWMTGAMEQFAFYAASHAAKNTPDGDSKAATNLAWLNSGREIAGLAPMAIEDVMSNTAVVPPAPARGEQPSNEDSSQ